MRHPSIRNAILAGLFVFSAPSIAAESGVQRVDEAWAKAMQANDIEAVVRTYASDAVAWFPNEKEARGEAAIRAAYEVLLGGNTVVSATTSETSYRMVGATSVGWGKFSLTLQPKAGGAPMVMTGRFTEVAVRKGDHWVYLVDHASADPAPAVAKQ